MCAEITVGGDPAMTASEFADLALSLPGVEESAHFGKRDFRAGGRIFATLPAKTAANLKLMPDQQMMVLEMHPGLFAALPNAWGARGWTSLDLLHAEQDVVLAALMTARQNVGGKKSKKA
jgi:hypothetical protein